VRLDRAERAADRLADLAGVVGGRWASACAGHAAALLTHDADALERVAAEFRSLGAVLLAAEAEMQAARAYRRSGAERRRRTATSRAEALAERCEGARTPALSVPETVVPLTRRELEIATLAGQGLASPEIARRLTVSTRTVEGHLHRMYAKLGVSRREELAEHIPA
jgi:ATP/maltotriose-dependent transcriptional regulator MalT